MVEYVMSCVARALSSSSSSSSSFSSYSYRLSLNHDCREQYNASTLVILSPLALYSQLGIFSVLSVGMMTLFYAGLLDLAKVFLDPLDNEHYCEGTIFFDLGVLIRESNAASVRWKVAAATLPFDATAGSASTAATHSFQ
jgi:hypothetical protein